MARHHFRRGRRDRVGDRPRVDRPRRRARASGSACCARPGSSGPGAALRSAPPERSSCRSTRPTRPRSARGWPGTPSRSRSSARTPPRSPRSRPSATSCPACATSWSIEGAGAGDGYDRARRSCARAGAGGSGRARRAGPRPSRRLTRTRSSTPRARPARRRAASSPTATTAPCWTWSPQRGIVGAGSDDLIYLFLPLAHAFGLLLMLISADRGVAIAYWGGDTDEDHPRAVRGPSHLPAVGAADLREALHAGHLARRPRAGGHRRPRSG